MPSPATSFSARLLAARHPLLYLVRGEHSRRHYWAVLLVDKSKLPQFERQLGGSMVLQHYGEILAWGTGETLSQAAKTLLKEKYGLIPDE